MQNVSSIIPWRDLTDSPSSDRRKFNLELLFLLQLLVILTLVLALIRFYMVSSIQVSHKIFILDTSASMLANEEGGTRLAKIKAQALELIENMLAEDSVMLIQAGAYPQQITPFLDSKTELGQAIDELEGKETAARLQEALQLALSLTESPGGYKITIFTDHEEPGLKKLAGGHTLEFRTVGKRNDNVAITALDVYQGLYDYSQRKAYVGLRNFSSRSEQFKLKIYLDKALKWEKELSLSAGESTTIPLVNLNQPGILKAQLVINDALYADNVAYAVISPNKQLKCLAVTADQELAAQLKRIASVISGLELTLIPPKQYSPSVIKQYNMVMFHHLVPDPLPPVNALFIMPSPDNAVFKVRSAKLDKPRIMDWNKEHTTLKYLNFLDEIPLDNVLRLEPPVWASVLMKTQDFPLAWEGEYQGRRLICLGFEIGDYLFPDSLDVSTIVLLLNMLDWLTPQLTSASHIKTGDKYILKHTFPIKKASIITPGGEEIGLSTEQATISFGDTDQVGLYELSALDDQGKEIKRKFVANLLNEAESNIAPTPITYQEPVLAPQPAAQGALTQKRLELWPYIILTVLLFLFIEWWVYFKKLA